MSATATVDLRCARLPEALSEFPDNYFHAALFDPPYGLSDPPPPDLLLKWLAGEDVEHSSGFLSRAWDSLPPGPNFWRELYRVIRPGGVALAFCHSRTFGLTDMAMRMAGWHPLPFFAWLHAEGQAHGANVGKLIDAAAGARREVIGSTAANPERPPPSRQRGIGGLQAPRDIAGTSGTDITAPATPLAKLFNGHHTRLRSLMEPIAVGLKPPDGTWAENAEKWGCGVWNVELGRVPTAGEEDDEVYAGKHASVVGLPREQGLTHGEVSSERENGYSPDGRYPGNVLLEHSPGCHPERCVPGCPAEVLRGQSGELGRSPAGQYVMAPSSSLTRDDHVTPYPYRGYGDSGACDRFYFQARPARKERSAGCEGLFWRRVPTHPDGWALVSRGEYGGLEPSLRFDGNPHPALKSIDLCRYLAKLVRQPGEPRLLVPFSGSGSEVCGALLAGWRDVTAIEGSEQMVEVARRRVAFWQPLAEAGAGDADIGELLGEFWEPLRAEEEESPQMDLFGGDP